MVHTSDIATDRDARIAIDWIRSELAIEGIRVAKVYSDRTQSVSGAIAKWTFPCDTRTMQFGRGAYRNYFVGYRRRDSTQNER